jgi:hypothetical protein
MIAPADTTAPLCACGCGAPVTRGASGQWNRFLPSHAGRVNKGDYALDARCAALVESGLSMRVAGEELGISHANVHMRVQRFRRMNGAGPDAIPYPVRVAALGHMYGEWQTVGECAWRDAEGAVRALRRTALDARNGGEWVFRRWHLPEGRAAVQAKWLGVPCTNCGAVSPDSAACPLCGYEREG